MMSSSKGQSGFEDAHWFKALTLRERAASLEACGDADFEVEAGDPARNKLERWRSQPPFREGSQFARRLASEGLTEPKLLRLLAEPAGLLSARLPGSPAWLKRVGEAFSTEARTCGATPGGAGRGRPGWQEGFIKGVGPLIAQGVCRLREGLRRLEGGRPHPAFCTEVVVGLFMPGLCARLSGHAARTMTLELNVARLNGLLRGETPRERFDYFNRLLEDADFLIPLLREYPVLARQVVTTVENWAAQTLALLTRLSADWDEIVETFAEGREPGPLSEVSGEAGDSHRGGRAVRILTFEGGFKLVYKPRSLAADAHFGELLAWLNARGDHPPLRSARVLDRGEYGWAEFIAAAGCADEGEVRRFYRRQGGLLALLYAIEATDFHLENLIAAGEHPVPIDLEALFHPRVSQGAAERQARSPAIEALNNSVLRVGLLPQRSRAGDGDEGIDLSGMGGAAGQLTPFAVLGYENVATDEMRAVRTRLKLPGAHNRPRLQGREINLHEYTDDIVAGFATVYRLLLRERAELLGAGGPLMKFGADEVRCVLRPTQTYASLLAESFHPDLLRDALDRSCFFDNLWRRTQVSPEYFRVVTAEVRDLEQGDIPFFSARPDSRDLRTSDNRRIESFFEESGLDRVRRRIGELSEEDLKRQTWLISASISSLSPGLDGSTFAGRKPGARAREGAAGRGRLLTSAAAVADRLEELAVRDETSVNWIGLTFLGERQWALLPLAQDLYDGTSGVGLFLAYAGDVLNERRYTALARLVVADLARGIETWRDADGAVGSPLAGLGGYGGTGGLIYTLAHLGRLWGDASLLALAESLIPLLPARIENDEALDVIGGSAGCILNLLALYRCVGSGELLALARRCGDRLVSHAEPQREGRAWKTVHAASAPLTGFSHGASGIAYALLALAEATGEADYRRCALDALAYESGLFSPAQGNWPDLRACGSEPGAEGKAFMVTWCHGAPGIGLSRLAALRQAGEDQRLHAELEAAVGATLKAGFGLNHSICHGGLGNLEFLVSAARQLPDASLRRETSRISSALLDSMDGGGWVCGTPQGVETPGLMTGLAGIGYGLLRLAEPERVPSVLTLSPPPGAGLRTSAHGIAEGAPAPS